MEVPRTFSPQTTMSMSSAGNSSAVNSRWLRKMSSFSFGQCTRGHGLPPWTMATRNDEPSALGAKIAPPTIRTASDPNASRPGTRTRSSSAMRAMVAATPTAMTVQPVVPIHWVAPRGHASAPTPFPRPPHGNPPNGHRSRVNSHRDHRATVASHQRVGGSCRIAHIPRAKAAANAPSASVSGIQATNPRSEIHRRVAPKNTAPKTKPSQLASPGRSALRSAHRRGAGATNTRAPMLSGGKATHISTADVRAASRRVIVWRG